MFGDDEQIAPTAAEFLELGVVDRRDDLGRAVPRVCERE
jgi:hypothetical protein